MTQFVDVIHPDSFQDQHWKFVDIMLPQMAWFPFS